MRSISCPGALVATAASAVVAAGAPAAPKAPERVANATLRIWVDADSKAALERVSAAWASPRGVDVRVVTVDLADVRDRLRAVGADHAPHVVVASHEWTGELASDGSVVPIRPRGEVVSRFRRNALDAFTYGPGIKRLYGAPVSLENVALVVNTRLARVPRSFADFEQQALAFGKKKRGNLAVAVSQGPDGDAYHMYPFFSGLGGYVFGRNSAGHLDPSDIGVAARRFLANSGTIDAWSRSGLIESRMDYATARKAFLEGRAAFWLTGPREADTLDESSLGYRIVQLPAVRYRSVPMLRVQGFMITKFASQNGVESLAQDLVGDHLMGARAQGALAAAIGLFPANTTAGRRVDDRGLRQFGTAGIGAVPVPNIPEMSVAWSELGRAWARSTSGPGATKARTAFSRASRNIADRIGP